MSESPAGPILYQVSYSERVRAAIRNLVARARLVGLAQEVLVAVKEIDRRLQIYPQFGQPLRDLTVTPAQLWIGVVPPLVIRYLLDEDRRLVMVGFPPTALPGTGL